MSHTWQIKVFTPTGTEKQTYTQASAGFGPEITWDIEPSGNCLNGSFQAIPSMVDIDPRDLVQISVDGDNKFFGYVTNGPNPYSKRLATYNLEGTKKLLYDTIIDSWWFDGRTKVNIVNFVSTAFVFHANHGYSTGDYVLVEDADTYYNNGVFQITVNDPDEYQYTMSTGVVTNSPGSYVRRVSDPNVPDLIPHRDIMKGLVELLPGYITGLSNNASLTSGNKGPIVAADYSLGDVFEGIIGSSFDAELYVWGVDADRQMFVKPVGTSTVDFRAVKKNVEYSEQNADDVCTSVRFIFSYPEAYNHPDLDRSMDALYGSFGTGNMSVNPAELAPLVYEYEDAALVAEYGKITKTVPLTLTDSWTKAYTLNQIASEFPSLTISLDSFSSWGNMRTENNATTNAAKINSISTPGTASHVKNSVVFDSGVENLSVSVWSTSPETSPVAVMTDLAKILFGVHIRCGIVSSPTRFFEWLSYVNYAEFPDTVDGLNNVGIGHFPTADTSYTWSSVNLNYLLPKMSLISWTSDPNETQTSASSLVYRKGDVVGLRTVLTPAVNFDSPLSYDIAVGNFKVYEWWFLGYNTEALDGYAKTFIVEPAEFPSRITVKGDLGIAPFALVDAETDEVTTKISRISHTLSPSMGYVTRYTTGRDDQRSNQFLSRMFNRDSSAQNTAFITSQVRF